MMSAASYEWFEMQFLRFKHLFAKVQSGNLDKNTEGVVSKKNEDELHRVSN